MNWSRFSLVVASILIFLFWVYIPADEYEDPDDRFFVTFTYDCRTIVDDEDVPEHVLEECRKLFKELENESSKNKPSI